MKNNRNNSKIIYALGMFLFITSLAKGQLIITLSPSNVNCEGLRTGQITANAAGGVPPYQYKWSNSQTTQSISNLDAGYYHCYVIDANGNVAENELTLTEPEEFRIIQFDATIYSNNYNTSCFGCNDGAITVTVAGGTPPYTYAWSDGSSLQNRINLVAKDYQLVVTDAFGCQVRELNKELSKPERDDWTPSGNANATSASFLGTTNQMPLQFKAGNNLGFTLMPNANALFTGKIGVGTNNPVEKFEVSGGNARFGGDVKFEGNIKMNNIPSFQNLTQSEILLKANDGSIGRYGMHALMEAFQLDAFVKTFNPSSCNAYYQNLGSDGLITSIPDNFHSYIASSTGGVDKYYDYMHTCTNVYIGEDPTIFASGNTGFINYVNDGTKLRVFGNVYSSGTIRTEDAIGVACAPDGTNMLKVSGNSLFNGNSVFTGDLKIINTSNNNQVNFKVDNTGNVYARKIEVLASGTAIPDYVFDKEYNLLSLPKLDEFINKYHHLPNISSAQEYNDKGVIDINELQLKLLQKIEELSLYVIQQQKEIEELKAKLK